MALILAGVIGYLLGAVPTGVLTVKALRGVDIRQQGSGHTGGLNVSRAAGLWGGVFTAIVDALLGAAAVLAAESLSQHTWAGALAAVMAIIGHNWSCFIRFGGGIGISTLAGSLLILSPAPALATLLALLLLWLLLTKLLQVHRARATVVVMLLVGPWLYLWGFATPAIMQGMFGGLIVILKTLPDWNRRYTQATSPPA